MGLCSVSGVRRRLAYRLGAHIVSATRVQCDRADEKPPRNKLASLMSVPLIEYREHAKFDASMAALFADASLQSTPFAAAAKEAANCFGRRSAYWSARVGVFDNRSIVSRLQAYRDTRSLIDDAPLWFGSRIKDLVLGVFGLGSTWAGRALLR